MTVTSTEIFIYITALIILFITPGPVWIALIARTISGGAKSGLSLVSGVCLGDMLWPIVVFLGFINSPELNIVLSLCITYMVFLSIWTLIIISKSKKGENHLSGFQLDQN